MDILECEFELYRVDDVDTERGEFVTRAIRDRAPSGKNAHINYYVHDTALRTRPNISRKRLNAFGSSSASRHWKRRHLAAAVRSPQRCPATLGGGVTLAAALQAMT